MKTRNVGILFALFAGLLAGALLWPVAFGDGHPARAQQQERIAVTASPASEVGRYALTVTPPVHSESGPSVPSIVYVIDTKTGRVWQNAQTQLPRAGWQALGGPPAP